MMHITGPLPAYWALAIPRRRHLLALRNFVYAVAMENMTTAQGQWFVLFTIACQRVQAYMAYGGIHHLSTVHPVTYLSTLRLVG